MGRSTHSLGLPPASVRKDQRAKQARHIVNKAVPALLASNARARRGAEGSQLFVDPPAGNRRGERDVGKADGRGEGEEEAMYVKRKGQGRRKMKERDGAGAGDVLREEEGKSSGKRGKRRGSNSLEEGLSSLSISIAAPTHTRRERHIRIINTDTLTAAHILTFPAQYPSLSRPPSSKPRKKDPNVCILNMASPLRPGGGILAGATSQEEFLCARTTLLPSLKESFYRLPEIGGVYTRDVLVFRDSGPLGALDGEGTRGELRPGERWWVDVVSAGMLRFPELELQGEERRLGEKDREVVERKMRAVLRIAEGQGVRRLVLGAWGCGAYGNPVNDVAAAWRKVLDGKVGEGKKGKGGVKELEELETWDCIDEVVFAISNAKMAREFAEAFGGGIEVEAGPGEHGIEEEEEEEDKVAQELRSKISEMEVQIGQARNPDLKTIMGTILDDLRSQLAKRELRSKISEMEIEIGQVLNPELKTRMGIIMAGLRSQLRGGGGGKQSDEDEEDESVEGEDEEGSDSQTNSGNTGHYANQHTERR